MNHEKDIVFVSKLLPEILSDIPLFFISVKHSCSSSSAPSTPFLYTSYFSASSILNIYLLLPCKLVPYLRSCFLPFSVFLPTFSTQHASLTRNKNVYKVWIHTVA